jgi:phospholipid/cholesterol/gamma-HCH transport system substrate-binding protein
MQKTVPSPGRILVMLLFALSCFGLLLFLWLSFGGSIPFQPQGYRFQAAFPQAAQLANQADVREAGISIGKVVSKKLDPEGNRTLATIQLNPRYAPIHKGARAILRQKTLLGETYIELTPGPASAGNLPDGALLPRSHVIKSVQLDQVFDAFDAGTRRAFRQWQADLASALQGNGRNLNDVLGNLPPFVTNANDVLTVLDVENVATRRLIRDSGQVFGALGRDQAALRRLITTSEGTFSQTAAQDQALEATFHVFPTFLDESKATLARLQSFATDTDPLIRELRPVARDLVPTLRDVRDLAPSLRDLFHNLGPLITVSQRGLPALTGILHGARPLLDELGPFLSQLNPVLRYLSLNQHLISDFIGVGAAGTAAKVKSPSGGTGHYLRQFQPVDANESLAIAATRAPSNRANPYLPPIGLTGPGIGRFLIYPAWDCKNASPAALNGPTATEPSCFTEPLPPFNGTRRFPHITADSPGG